MKVLFICTANVCRSPLAEGYLKYLLQKDPDIELHVSSAGVLARSGSSAFDCAIEVARLNQFDLTRHTARQLTYDMMQEADQILCMESWQATKVIDIDVKSSHKVGLLGSWHSTKRPLLQIPDPEEFDVNCTQQTFDLIKDAIQNFLKNCRL